MKYIEELLPGDIFICDNRELLKTTDYKQSKTVKYLCVSIVDGSAMWMDGNKEANILDLYKRDSEGNILPFKEYKDAKDQHLKN